ncbi:hypothetical protein Pelo_8744 [Pelomyxa schiedti]|nr:hypothetical protein Pelo_8744 [Pelomyxa schiedti]
MNSELAKLIKACWSLLPAKRPSFTDIRASLRNILQDVRDQPMLLMPAFGRWEVTQRPIQGDLAKNLSNYAASSEKWTFSTEVLSFDFSNSSTNHPETQQFDIFNNTNSSFKYKIDKYTDCDLILAFTKGSGTIKPHTRKIIDVKVTVKIKTTKSLRIPVSLGTSKDFIDIIIRCDAGVFGVTPSLLPQGKEDDLKVPQILVDLKAALINNQGLQKVNIFLQAGDAAELKRLQELANRGEFSPKLPHNPHVIANLIKVWFRTLPQGLMNSISPNALMDSVTVLQFLVCSNPANKTTPKSISITIAPNLFFAHDLETTKLSGKCSDMIQTLIQARIAAPATSNNQSSTSTSSSTGAPTNTTTPSSSTGAPTSTRTNSTGAPSPSPSSTCLSTGSSPSPSPSPRVISANSSASTSTGSN